jgi:hypothetical protein
MVSVTDPYGHTLGLVDRIPDTMSIKALSDLFDQYYQYDHNAHSTTQWKIAEKTCDVISFHS